MSSKINYEKANVQRRMRHNGTEQFSSDSTFGYEKRLQKKQQKKTIKKRLKKNSETECDDES